MQMAEATKQHSGQTESSLVNYMKGAGARLTHAQNKFTPHININIHPKIYYN